MNKRLLLLGVGAGGLIGGYIPGLFGISYFSAWSIVGSMLGGIAGLWLMYKLSD